MMSVYRTNHASVVDQAHILLRWEQTSLPANNYWVAFYCASLLIISVELLLDIVCA